MRDERGPCAQERSLGFCNVEEKPSPPHDMGPQKGKQQTAEGSQKNISGPLLLHLCALRFTRSWPFPFANERPELKFFRLPAFCASPLSFVRCSCCL